MARVVDLGRRPFREVWAEQERLLNARIAGEVEDTVLLVEHEPPVYTLGRKRGAAANVLDPGPAEVIEVERGGDVTWHGPGQLVAYPIVALHGPEQDLHRWLGRLETVLIETVGDFGLAGGRDPRNTGLWVGGRKLGSIGIACRRWVTWHGLALNVDPDLSWFRRINPCGLDAALLSSMAEALGRPITTDEVKPALVQRLVTLGGAGASAG
jgi:lipoate-protein ligase B